MSTNKVMGVAVGIFVGMMGVGFAIGHFLGADGDHHQAHEHEHHGEAHGTLTLDDGAKWKTDAPLREGMGRIRDAVSTAAQGEIDATSAQELATTVDERVKFLFANCNLEPRADAMLHIVIGDLIGGASELRVGDASADGLARVQRAVADYEAHFEPAY